MNASAHYAAASSPIETAWQEWREASELFEQTGGTLSEADEEAAWSQIQSAVARIYNSTEIGPRAAEIRLWLALSRASIYKAEHAAVRREDLTHLLAHHGKMEEGADQVILAIRALQS